MVREQTGIVIVTFNSAGVIGPCLDSCLAAGAGEIVVVDNGSRDETVAEARRRPAVRCLVNVENAGFAAAVNQGIAAVDSDYILILNPDTRLLTGLGPLRDAAAEHGAACGLLMDSHSRPQTGFTFRRFPQPAALACEIFGVNRLWPGNPANRHYRCLDADLTRAADVEQPAGAFLMVRRDAWEEVGGFDAGFHPVWFEDVDFCKRLVEAGFRIRFIPSVTALHEGGHSVGRISWECRQVYWYASLLRYAAKHFKPVTFRLLCAAVMAAAIPRMLTAIHREGSSEPFVTCLKVVRLAGQSLVRGGTSPIAFPVAPEPAHRFVKTSSSTGS